jgi:predicted esterase YcpF (UPF0227 family)
MSVVDPGEVRRLALEARNLFGQALGTLAQVEGQLEEAERDLERYRIAVTANLRRAKCVKALPEEKREEVLSLLSETGPSWHELRRRKADLEDARRRALNDLLYAEFSLRVAEVLAYALEGEV